MAHTSRTVVTASFMRGEYIDRRGPGFPLPPAARPAGRAPAAGAAQNPWAVVAARTASKTTTNAERS